MPSQVILLQDVEKVGLRGEVVSVARGFARNYLLPRGLAVEANSKNLRAFEHQKGLAMLRREANKGQALKLKQQLEALALTISANAGEEGKLFGSVTNIDIERALRERGFDIERRKIMLAEPIKQLGEFTVPVRLDPEVEAGVKLTVAAS